MPDQGCKVGVSMLSLHVSDLAGGFVTDVWPDVVMQYPAFTNVVERYTVDLAVSLKLPRTRQNKR